MGRGCIAQYEQGAVRQARTSSVAMPMDAVFRSTAQLNLEPENWRRDSHPIVVVMTVNAARSTTPADRKLDLYQQIADTIGAVPGIERASGSLVTPISGDNWTAALGVAGAPAPSERYSPFMCTPSNASGAEVRHTTSTSDSFSSHEP